MTEYKQKQIVLSTSEFGTHMYHILKEDSIISIFYWREQTTPDRYDALVRFLYSEIIKQIMEVMDEDFTIFWTNVQSLPNKSTILGNHAWEKQSGLLDFLQKYIPEMAMHLYSLLKEYRLLSTPGLIPIYISPEQIILGVNIHDLSA